MLTIYKRELLEYFGNWSAWLMMAAFSVIGTLFLFFFENDFNFFDIGTASMQSFFLLAPWILLFIIPAISMRTFAEESQNGTLIWLFSQPISIPKIVLGKFISVLTIGCLCLLPSLVYFYTLYTLGVPEGNIDIGATLGSYIGLVLLIGAFASLGLWASALFSNQISAYLVGLILCFVFYFGIEQLASYRLLGQADFYLQNSGFYHHYIAFTRGLIDSKDVFYFLLVLGLMLFLTVLGVLKKK